MTAAMEDVMRRVSINMDTALWDALAAQAQAEYRPPKQQAEVILRRALSGELGTKLTLGREVVERPTA